MSDHQKKFQFSGPPIDLSPQSEMMQSLVRFASEAQATWLEEILEGLLSKGVSKEDIGVLIHSDRIEVQVYGEPRYVWKLPLTR